MARKFDKRKKPDVVGDYLIKSDVLGSYTGRCEDSDERPIQDADDL